MLRLEFAKGDGYGPCGGADCWGQAADDAHDQGEDDAADEQAAGDFEGEGHVAEGLPVHRGGGEAVERQHRKTADGSADEGDESVPR